MGLYRVSCVDPLFRCISDDYARGDSTACDLYSLGKLSNTLDREWKRDHGQLRPTNHDYDAVERLIMNI